MLTDSSNLVDIPNSDGLTIRKLDKSEEAKWLEMVVSCYAAKGTPREVFQVHLERTPSDERILLAVLDKEDNILSTLCLFLLRFGGIVVDDINDRSNLRDFTLKIGGIGDVCTLPKCRGQGLARQLLYHSIDVAKQNECDFSLLHSSKPHLQEYYHKLGWAYQASLSYGKWRVQLPSLEEDSTNDKRCVRNFSYSPERDDEDVEVMKQIKELHSRQNRNILGRLRNDFDWKSLGKSWKKADKNNARAKFMYYMEDKENENVSRIVAYVVFHIDVGNKHDKFHVLEYAGSQEYIEKIIQHFVSQELNSESTTLIQPHFYDVIVPILPSSDRKVLANVEELPELVDNGWRYLPLKQENKTSRDGLMTNINSNLLPAEFFIWRTDNF